MGKILSEIIVQALGFFVVFLILKKFAWSGILGTIDARRKKIQDEFDGIEKSKKGLEDLEKQYKAKLEHIEQEARVKIQDAANVGMSLAKDIQEKARADAQKMIERAKAEIDQDIAKARIQMRNDIVDLSGLITEKIIRERLDAKQHEKLVDQFIKDLEKVG